MRRFRNKRAAWNFVCKYQKLHNNIQGRDEIIARIIQHNGDLYIVDREGRKIRSISLDEDFELFDGHIFFKDEVYRFHNQPMDHVS